MQSLFGATCPCFRRPPTRRVRSGHLCTSSPTASGLQLAKAASSSGLYSSLGTHLSQQGDELWSLTTSLAQRLTRDRTILGIKHCVPSVHVVSLHGELASSMSPASTFQERLFKLLMLRGDIKSCYKVYSWLYKSAKCYSNKVSLGYVAGCCSSRSVYSFK